MIFHDYVGAIEVSFACNKLGSGTRCESGAKKKTKLKFAILLANDRETTVFHGA